MTISVNLNSYAVNADGSKNSNYPNGDKPAEITSVSGTYGQGNELTLTTTQATTKNTTQLMFACGDSAENGNDATAIVASQPVSNASNYKHSTAKSHMGTGASLLAQMQSGAGGSIDPYIQLASPQSELYFSSLVNIDINTAGLDSESQQLKMQRFNAEAGSSGEPALGRTLFWGTDDTNVTSSHSTIFSGAGLQYWPAARSFYELGLLGDKWFRTQMYWKASDVDTANGAIWYLESNETDGDTYLSARGPWPDYEDMNDPDQSNPSADISTWYKQWTPMDKLVTRRTGDSAGQNIDKVWLPFFKRDSSQIDVYVDGIYINDSCERVELGNASTYEACTKRVIQKQTNRQSGSIAFECYEGNLTTSDNVYAFVFNEDGTYSQGYLIRAAV